jgi:hypothetical protein
MGYVIITKTVAETFSGCNVMQGKREVNKVK